MITLETSNPSANLKEKQKELADVYQGEASILEYQQRTWVRVNGTVLLYDEFLEGQRLSLVQRMIIDINGDIVNLCANCEEEISPNKAITKWLLKVGIEVSHGICNRHYDEAIEEIERGDFDK